MQSPASPERGHPRWGWPSPASTPDTRRGRSNWALRMMACALSGLAFLGLWQLAAHSSSPAGQGYAPPSSTQGGLVLPSQFGGAPDGSTHIS
jgi:hypothetical protein